MPVLNKPELEKVVAEAVAMLDLLLLPASDDPESRPAPSVNAFVLEQAKGLIFTWTISGGMGVGFRAGQGFAIAKVDGRWSCPCFVDVASIAVGALAGISKVSTILFAETEKPMDALSRGQQSVVGKELSHVAVPVAIKAKSHLDLSEAVHKGSDLLSISYAEGLTVNFSVSGGTLMLDDARTKAMFGEGANGRTTLGGLDPTPAELAPLVAKIDEIIASGKAQA